jgi:hypothetical protein
MNVVSDILYDIFGCHLEVESLAEQIIGACCRIDRRPYSLLHIQRIQLKNKNAEGAQAKDGGEK